MGDGDFKNMNREVITTLIMMMMVVMVAVMTASWNIEQPSMKNYTSRRHAVVKNPH